MRERGENAAGTGGEGGLILTPIPQHLFSVFEDGPFSVCSVCDRPLCGEDGNRLYEIKKAYRGSNVVFECAICHECGLSLLADYSKESIAAIRKFFAARFKHGLTIFECHFCGKPRNPETSEASVMAVCVGKNLVQPPICMCDPCGEILNSSLSSRTRDVNRGFLRDNFPGIPADKADSPVIAV